MSSFATLHDRRHPLLLPNAWDAASARIFEDAGFPAIASTSAGVAYSLGFPDGGAVDVDEMIAAIARIARAVRVPVSADIEDGWREDIDGLLAVVERVHEARAIGINLEDWSVRTGGLRPLDIAAQRIAAVKSRFGDEVFINARTDLYLQHVGQPSQRFDMATERLRAFVQAGADGVFVPGISDLETIASLAAAVDVPFNVLAGPQTPSLRELASLGVARVSLGSWPMRRIMGVTRTLAQALREKDTFAFTRDPTMFPFADANELFR